jgi:hypothetical protein
MPKSLRWHATYLTHHILLNGVIILFFYSVGYMVLNGQINVTCELRRMFKKVVMAYSIPAFALRG